MREFMLSAWLLFTPSITALRMPHRCLRKVLAVCCIGLARSTFYRWKTEYDKHGEAGLGRKSAASINHPRKTPAEIVEKIVHLRRKYHLGPIRIVWYLERYHNIRVCDATVYRTLRRLGLNRLPRNVGRRKNHTKRYQKQVPGHHIQVDVKFLKFLEKQKGNQTVSVHCNR